MRIDTKLVHAGEPRPRIGGAVTLPIFQTSTYEYGGETAYHDVRYLRLSNSPNHLALHAKLAALEGGEAALVASSGMAAISGALLALLSPGDHVIAQECLYGGTHDFITKDLVRFGISHTFVDGEDRATWERALTPRTRLMYVETMTNPLLQVADLDGVVAFARERGLVSMIDNTLASPLNFRPPERGFDLSVHSATKYLNGHSDIVAGGLIGRGTLIARAKQMLDHLGGSLDPHSCFLLHRGLKTLAVRVRQQNRTALALAKFLGTHAAVERVHYAGLAPTSGHARAKELFAGYGGLLSFELKGGVAPADRLLGRLELAAVAPSLGGCETLITRPALTSHAGLDPEVRRRLGITDGLVRVAVGLEAEEDLIGDFGKALT